jgi:hypothetical protein
MLHKKRKRRLGDAPPADSNVPGSIPFATIMHISARASGWRVELKRSTDAMGKAGYICVRECPETYCFLQKPEGGDPPWKSPPLFPTKS